MKGIQKSVTIWADGFAQTIALIPVRAKAITAISVSPSTATIAALTTQAFTATATYNDLSTGDVTATVSWSSSNTGIATIAAGGVATGVAGGTVTITATSGAITGTASLTVTAAVVYGTGGYYPLTAAATRFRLGWGTWSAGYLCDEASGSINPSFGSPALSPGGTPTYHLPGPLGGTDYAIKLDSGPDYFYDAASSTDFDVGASDDFVFAWVGKMSALTGSQFTRVAAKSTFGSGGGAYQLGYYASLGSLTFEIGDASGHGILVQAGAGSAMPGTWYCAIAVLDRARGTVRIGCKSLASDRTKYVGAEGNVAGFGSLSCAAPFNLGGYSDVDWQVSAFYIAKGVGAAAGLSANMSKALDNFADGLFPSVLTTYSTADIIKQNRGNLVWVAAVEGYRYLLTNGDPRHAVAAWNYGSAVDWQLALPNLSVQLDRNHTLNPWVPFDKGSDFQISVAPEQLALFGSVADQFGIDVAKRSAGAETQLTATADRAASTLNVKQTASFPAAGEVYIGTECIDATVATGTTFTATKRGKYSIKTATGVNYAEHHRVGTDALGVQLEPVVSQYPRDWAGKWVQLWLHWSDGTRLNPVSSALCVYEGRWQSYSDDGSSTTVNVKSVLDGVGSTVLGRDLWTAKVQAGYYIVAGQTVTLSDNNYTAGWKTSNPLTVVASGASGTNQINAGKYTREDLASAITSWLVGEYLAGRIYGNYTLNPAENINTSGPADIRSVFHWYIGSTAAYGEWTLDWQWGAIFGGFANHFTINPESSNAWHPAKSPAHPQANGLFTYSSSAGFSVSCTIEQASGHFVDQYALLPASIKSVLPTSGGGLQWGCFMFNESTMFVGSFVDGTTEIDNMQTVDTAILGGLTDINALLTTTLNAGDPLPPIRQVFLLEDTLALMLKKLFYSTGTAGHNSSSFDVLGYGLGLALPGSSLGATFEQSCDALPGANTSLMVRIDKPTKFSDLLDGDLVLRRSFPKWKLGTLQMGTWYTPTVDQAIATLDETNKAEPVGNKSPQNAVTIEDTTYVKNIIKLYYNRDFSAAENYNAVLILEDRVSVDDSGGEGATVEISARNSYGAFQNTGTAIESLWPGFMASATMFTRPTSKVVRSANLTLFEQLSIGDTVLFSDKTARDPATGQRAVLLRPALITRHHVNYGGPGVPAVGEVELFFMPQDRIATYAPSATVDSTINAGGFSAGYNSSTLQLQCVDWDFNEFTETIDPARFNVNDDVRLTEIDPFDPSNPLTWTRTITARSGDLLTINSALTSPAWDPTKKYRLTYDHFGADQTAQKLKAFQSSSVTGQLESSGAPYQYGIQPGNGFTVNTGNEQAELYALLSYGDGKPRDVGYDRAAIRTLNALIDYRSGKQAPSLSNTILENTTYSSGAGYQLAYLFPVFVGTESYPVTVKRSLRVAPFFRSSTGVLAKLRVTLSPYPTTSSSKNDVTFFTPIAQANFSTSSTTWGTPAEVDIPITFRPADGIVWVHVELTLHCQTRGLALCKEGPRQ